MTTKKLIEILSVLPDDCVVMSNSGWECDPSDVEGIWYSEELNEVHLTQGGRYENREGYSCRNKCFKKIYCNINTY